MIDYKKIVGRGVISFIDRLNKRELNTMLNNLNSDIEVCRAAGSYMLKNRIIEKRYILKRIRGIVC